MGKLPIYSRDGQEKSSVDLPDEIFGGIVNTKVIYQAIVMYQACLRQGTVNTKERAEVRGGGKKPFRQKGTGRARAGSTRSPLWKGGGTTFGPHPRDFHYTVPKKIKRAALKESVKAKYLSNQIFCLEEITESMSKTKEVAAILKALSLKGKILGLLDGCDASLLLASRNIPKLKLLRSEDVNAYDILRNKTLLLTKTSIDKLIERIQK